MWTWDQSAGKLFHNGNLVSSGYAGKGRGKNNPALQGVQGIGPIPRGKWKILAPYNSNNTGKYTLPLHKVDSNPNDDFDDVTGRGAFRCHGDSIKAPGTASQGCIILPLAIRMQIWQSGDHDLEVVE